ncbi:unnamed protein product [Heterobilharzia americana]|nr:unnamed protein product [Heterobilharzia americana]
MSVFLSTKLKDSPGVIKILEWHSSVSVFAVALQTRKECGEVTVSSLQDWKCEDTSIVRPFTVTCLSWHPFEETLLIGWDNGCMTVFNASERNTFDISHKVEASVTSLVWSSDVCIFEYARGGDFEQKNISVSNVNSNISCAVSIPKQKSLSSLSCEDVQPAESAFSQDNGVFESERYKVLDESKRNTQFLSFELFVVGCSDGRVVSIIYDSRNTSEMNNSSNVACCEGSVLNMLSHKRKRILLVITDKGLLYHYHITFGNVLSLKEMAKMKLASTLCSQPSITWAGDTTLAMGLGEPVVRLWDVERADNYTLNPNLSSLENSKTDVKVLHLAYSETCRVLAAGLNNGVIAFWQYGTELESVNDVTRLLTQGCNSFLDNCATHSLKNSMIESRPETNWHPQPSATWKDQQDEAIPSVSPELNHHILLITWGDKQEKLSVVVLLHQSIDNAGYGHGMQAKSSLYILQRQSLHTHFYGNGCVVVQTGPRSFSMLTTVPDTKTSASINISHLNVLNDLPTTNGNKESKKEGVIISKDANSINFPGSFITKSIPIMTDTNMRRNSKYLINQKNASLYEHEAQVEDQIKAIFCTQEYVAYWNGYRISVFRHSTGDCIIHLVSFACEFKFIGMHQQNIFTVEPYKLQVRNLEGCVKQLVSFSETEGSVILTSQCANYMACLTDHHKVRVFDLSRREIKSTITSKSLIELVICEILNQIARDYNTSPFRSTKSFQQNLSLLRNSKNIISNELNISWISINKSGNSLAFTVEILLGGKLCQLLWPCSLYPLSKLSGTKHSTATLTGMTADKMNEHVVGENIIVDMHEDVLKQWIPDPNIYIYHLDVDKLKYFNFFETISNSITVVPEAMKSGEDYHTVNLDLIRLNSTKLIERRWPKHHYWDQYEPRLLVVEASPISDNHPIITSKINSLEKMDNQCNDLDYTVDITDNDQYSSVESRSTSKQVFITPEIRDRSEDTQSKVLTSIVSLFISPEQNNTVVQGSFLMSVHHSALIGVEVPLIYFSVRCDLVFRVINEQYQRRLEMFTTSGRRVISEADYTSTQQSLNSINSIGSRTDMLCITEDKRRQTQHQGVTDETFGDQLTTDNRIHYINRRVMQNFVGLEDADEKTREAMLNFSYYLALGEMDSAFRAMKLIKSPAVWQNMARMCVTTCRLDVARICLGKINNPMASKMIRESRFREPEIEAQAGELALQLSMPDEAERLFIQCNRWDLVIRLHQSLGNWSKAVTTAEQHHRMSLRGIHYAYAEELESLGKIQEAIENYIKSETYRFEVPRMLKNKPELLESFVTSQADQSIKRWWAQTLEAQGRLEEAKKCYHESKDYLSLVRVLCCLGQEAEAETVCNETGDAGACHHLARHLEPKGGIDQAIRLFTRAKAYSSAIRICKEHNRNDHLFSLAQLGRPDDMLESAKHLEKYPSYVGKAVLLYHKAGNINRAVELAFSKRQFSALQSVAGSLDERIDPIMLKQCSEFFIQNDQFDRAVEVLAAGKQYWDALKLCGDHNVPISEELAEKLTPTSEKLTEKERCSLLVELGELCLTQGKYHLACKKFTQAGSRVSAMKSLLRSGDTEKVVFFANVSKQKEIYVMAANYLQTLNDWRSNMNIMRNIVQFYTRGHALESLASFYEACAQGEIEDGGNYEKATGALNEAYKVLVKALNSNTVNESSESRLKKRLLQVKNKAKLCKEFAETQQ